MRRLVASQTSQRAMTACDRRSNFDTRDRGNQQAVPRRGVREPLNPARAAF